MASFISKLIARSLCFFLVGLLAMFFLHIFGWLPDAGFWSGVCGIAGLCWALRIAMVGFVAELS